MVTFDVLAGDHVVMGLSRVLHHVTTRGQRRCHHWSWSMDTDAHRYTPIHTHKNQNTNTQTYTNDRHAQTRTDKTAGQTAATHTNYTTATHGH